MKLRRHTGITLLGLAVICASGCARQRPAAAILEKPAEVPYVTPLLSPGTKFASLPPAVQHTIRAETGSAEIEDIVRDTNSVPPLYRIYFVNYAEFPPLYVAPDGSVLNPDLTVAMGASRETVSLSSGGPATDITRSDLPPNVVRSIQREAPQAEVDTITKEKRGDDTVYHITFKGRSHTSLIVGVDGSVLAR